MQICFGVCIVGVHARVLARACGCELRRCCRMGRAPQDAALPVPTSGTAVQRLRAPTHLPFEALFTEFFFFIGYVVQLLYVNYVQLYVVCMCERVYTTVYATSLQRSCM